MYMNITTGIKGELIAIGEMVTIDSTGQTIISYIPIEGITLGAGEQVEQVAWVWKEQVRFVAGLVKDMILGLRDSNVSKPNLISANTHYCQFGSSNDHSPI